jgi:hypothetical protein
MKASSCSYSIIVHFYIRTGLLLVVRCLILFFNIVYEIDINNLYTPKKPASTFIAPITDLSNALPKSTDNVYRKVFPPNPRGIFEILRLFGTVHCESHSMC